MFTIKNVLPDGSEDVVGVLRVSFSPAKRNMVTDGNTGQWVEFPDTVYGESESGTAIPFVSGTIYVMNDSGRTVATYHLDYPKPNGDVVASEKLETA